MLYVSDKPGWEVVREWPGALLRPGVVLYQGRRTSLERPKRRLEVPSGTVTLLLGFGNSLRITDVRELAAAGRSESGRVGRACAAPKSPRSRLLGQAHTSLLSPLRSHGALGEHSGTLEGMDVVLQPWAAYRLFGVPMHEWADRFVPPADLLGPRVDLLTEALACQPGWRRRFELLDATLTRWWHEGPEYAPQVRWAWEELRRTAGRVPVGHLADRTDWGWRQLEKRFRQQIGLPPKVVARIMRLQHVLRLLRAGQDAAGAALTSGYSDQAHMTREVRRMTGFPPGRLLSSARQGPSDPATGERVYGRATTFQVPGARVPGRRQVAG